VSAYITQQALAEALGGCSTMTIWRLRQRDDFPKAYRVGGRVLFNRDEIDAWIEMQAEGVKA